MALIPCPSCGLFRATEDADRPCPVCGRRASDPTPWVADIEARADPVSLTPAPPPEPEPDHDGRRNRVLVAGTLAVAAAVIAAMAWEPWVASPPSAPVPLPAAGLSVSLISSPAITLPVTRFDPEPAPAPRPQSFSAADFVPVVDPNPELIPQPRPTVPPGGVSVLRVNRPTEDFHLPRLGEGNRVRLVGTVRRLLVDGVDGGATLDASDLTAKEVFFYGRVDGASTVAVRSSGGVVGFREKIGGRSDVTVDAGAGSVLFAVNTPKPQDPAGIGGGAVVRVTAKAVTFTAPISGPDTHVTATLTAGGSMHFTAVDGAAKLHYRQADPTGPPPKVKAGAVRGGAECRAVP